MAFRCPICHTISENPNDEREAYCVRCHTFTNDAVRHAEPEPEPDWPGIGWQDHCGDPDCEICPTDGVIPPARLALWQKWQRWQVRRGLEDA
jgi:hypothetical protein